VPRLAVDHPLIESLKGLAAGGRLLEEWIVGLEWSLALWDHQQGRGHILESGHTQVTPIQAYIRIRERADLNGPGSGSSQ